MKKKNRILAIIGFIAFILGFIAEPIYVPFVFIGLVLIIFGIALEYE
jgi:membrane-bound ClpP family serine protease